jgi:D-sedoheptulose 7-phosphate isomerase
MNPNKAISIHLLKTSKALKDIDLYPIQHAVNILFKARMWDKRVWLVGNGGSAATASHFSNDLQKICGIDAISLPDRVSSILAYGNDDGWDRMFSNAMIPFRKGDVLIAISCSGASANVLRAVEKAQLLSGEVIVMTGKLTEKNALGLSGYPATIIVDFPDIKVQEDVHLVICHTIAGVLAK